ncbi:uncharacterized protein DDB_G0285917-like [Mercenaria mercenaria]|uniref:uncharacterized protein DDB_G0285917-like n=1 Tax=Mercenaria mercenaria TaxID=6596 RepID=UPI00234FB1CA|nr:uncharacterized protein DDB_G0285917-like [Mercenaria mercenaria]
MLEAFGKSGSKIVNRCFCKIVFESDETNKQNNKEAKANGSERSNGSNNQNNKAGATSDHLDRSNGSNNQNNKTGATSDLERSEEGPQPGNSGAINY